MTTEAKLLTAEDLWEISHQGQGYRYELLDGVLVEMAPNNEVHGWIESKFGHYLWAHVEEGDLGAVLTGDVGYFLRRNPDRVRAPDVCFIARNRIPAEGLSSRFSELIPDLVVEVVSPSDTAAEVEQKAMEWLAAGVRLVLVAFPATRSVLAYRSPTDVRRYSDADTVDAEPVLPGFACPVARLFP